MSRILGVGTDIIEIARFSAAWKRHNQKFLDKLFTKREQEHCFLYSDPTGRFAARFSAKEAVVKALGHGFGEALSFLDIEILNEPSGKPIVVLSEKCAKHFGSPLFHISISHCHNYATATVIACLSDR